mgnify:CR=1 FL=1|tara:strand:+ start:53 stop:499 length:447 start_codon:yes stop_codon:yes gene_type:complete
MFPLLALPYITAGIGTLGAGARALGSPQGQRFLQGGINTLNRFGTRLQDFLQPASQMITQQAIQRPISAGSVIPFAMEESANTVADIINKLIEKEEDEDKKDKKKKKTKKDEIPEVPMKKGGMVKPKKKRKKYKSGTFVKMKGRKRYI